MLWDAPDRLPNNCWKPSVPDLYRYSLSQNCVDICLTGWRNRSEIDQAISALEKGKLTTQEINYLNLYGDLHRQRITLNESNSKQLIYQ